LKKSRNNSKKSWIKRLYEEMNRLGDSKRRALLREFKALEDELKSQGLEIPQLKLFLDVTRKRLGISEIPVNELREKIIRILEREGGILHINTLHKKLLTEEKIAINIASLEKELFLLRKKGTVYINRGVVAISRPADTMVGKRVLDVLREKGRVNINQLSSLLNIEKRILNIIIESLSEDGVIVYDHKTGEIMIV